MAKKAPATPEAETVQSLDRRVSEGKFPNRSWAIQRAAGLPTQRDQRERLSRELSKLDPNEERALAEEPLGDAPWPEF